MKKLYRNLITALWSFVGVFIGSSIYKYYHYRTYLDLYEMQSAPWYSSILIHGIFTVIFIVVILITMWIVRKKINKTDSSLNRRL